VRALRAAGYEVRTVHDLAPRATDEEVIALALRERCVLLTEDLDFGRLAFAAGRAHGGVVLIRSRGRAREALADTVVRGVRLLEADLGSRFVVIEPGQVRGFRSGTAESSESR